MSAGHLVERRSWDLVDRGPCAVGGEVWGAGPQMNIVGTAMARSSGLVRTLWGRGRRKWSIACIRELTVLAFSGRRADRRSARSVNPARLRPPFGRGPGRAGVYRRGGGWVSATQRRPGRGPQKRQWHAYADTWERDGRLSDRDQARDPPGAGSRIPERQHSTKRVADDRRGVEFERVEDVVDQLPGTLTDVTASIAVRVRQPMPGKVDREHPPTGQRAEQGRPRSGAERHAVEQNQWRTAPV